MATSDILDEAMGGTFQLTRGQQDKGDNDYLESHLQKFVENEQNGKDYDLTELAKYDSTWAHKMDDNYARLEQESDDGSDIMGNTAKIQQESEEGRTGQDLSNIQQVDDGDSMNKVELQQDEKDDDGKFDAFLQQMERGRGGDNQNIDSLLQQIDDGESENKNKMGALGQQMKDGSDYNEKQGLLQQQEDGGDKNDIDTVATQDNEGEANGNEEENAAAQWNNYWDGPLKVRCAAGYGLSSVYSIFNSGRRDRRFSYGCRRVSFCTGLLLYEYFNKIYKLFFCFLC